jgi:dTDP-D-glucose 4,6-dehydratase
MNLLNAAKTFGKIIWRRVLITLATDEVYGSLGAEGCTEPTADPTSYSASKASSDYHVYIV